MIIRNKFNGYSADGTRLYPAGGGGGPTTNYTQTSNIPDYARPYVEQMLGATQRQLFTGQVDPKTGLMAPTGFSEFTPYGATYQKDANGNPLRDAQGRILYTNTAADQARAAVAGPSVGQQIAQNRMYNYVAPRQTQDASNIAAQLAGRAVAAGQYNPMQAQSYLLGGPQQVHTGSFTTPGTAQRYMSPYMQNVVQQQQREAQRQGDVAASNRAAQAIGAGAFGGSRQAIENAEANRNLATQLSDIQGQGLQNAYQSAQGQFNTEQGAGLTAQQSNQQANLNAAIQNQQALQKAQTETEASRQFGANLGLQGINAATQNANLLGQMGQQQYGQDIGSIQALNTMGGQDQAQQQALINQQVQNYATNQQYPLMQLGVMSNMLRGLPMQSTNTQMYQQQPSLFNQAAGAVGTGLSLAKDYKTLNSAKGGAIKLAPGGIATGVPAGKLEAELRGPQFSDQELQKKASDPQTDQATKDLVTAEQARRSGLRSGAKAMAPGGIVAFAGKDGSEVKEDEKDKIENTVEQNVISKLLGNPDLLSRRPETSGGIAAAPAPAPAEAAPVDAAPTMMNASKLATAQGKTPAPAGIAAATDDSPISGVSSRLPADLQSELSLLSDQQDKYDLLRKSTVPQEVERKRAERIALGLPSYYDTEKTNVQNKQVALKEQAKSDAEDRLHKFLIVWGRTPGSVLKGVIEGGYDLAHQQELDKKEQRKQANELDGILSHLNESEYLRQIGDMDGAEKAINEAGEKYYKLGVEKAKIKADYNIKMMDQATKMEIAQLKAEVASAKTGSKAPDLQVIDQLFHTLVGEGKPADAKTYHAAIAEYYKSYKPAGALGAAVIGQTYKPEELDIKKRLADLEAANTTLKDQLTQATVGKTTAETQGKIQENVDDALRSKENRAAIADAGDKGYRGKKGKEAEALKRQDIADSIRSQSKPAAASKPAEPKKDDKKDDKSNRAKADEILKAK
jgi:hypothetical protein